MNADPEVQRTLLDLAAVDAELAQIAHRRKSLPEQQEVGRLETERSARKDAAVAVEIGHRRPRPRHRKLEGEVDAVRKREDRDRTLLSRAVGAKQLTELEHELGTLDRRQAVSRTSCSR